MDILALELRKLGLKEKEVKIYLAGLELGHTSVQAIAKKAGISRPTCYQLIKLLEKRGLMAESKTKGKTFYSIESPDRLLSILRVEKRELEEKEREFVRIISTLKAKYYLAEKSEIRNYEGAEGIKFLTDDFSQTQSREIFIAANKPNLLKPWQEKYKEIRKRLGEGVKINESFSKKIPGALILYDKIVYLPPSKKALGLLIENPLILNLLKSFYLASWKLI